MTEDPDPTTFLAFRYADGTWTAITPFILMFMIIVYLMVFQGMRFGRQSLLVSLMWPGMLDVLLADRLRERETKIEHERASAAVDDDGGNRGKDE